MGRKTWSPLYSRMQNTARVGPEITILAHGSSRTGLVTRRHGDLPASFRGRLDIPTDLIVDLLRGQHRLRPRTPVPRLAVPRFNPAPRGGAAYAGAGDFVVVETRSCARLT